MLYDTNSFASTDIFISALHNTSIFAASCNPGTKEIA